MAIVFLVMTIGCSKDDDSKGQSNNPNILLVIADDMGIEATPGYDIGAEKPQMPNLQSLANTGMTFDNVWSFPLCSPTRSSILTGRYGYRTGVLNATNAANIDANETTLHQYLTDRTNGTYAHAIIGKWHLSPNEPDRPEAMGVGYYAGVLGGAVTDYEEWPFTANGSTDMYSGYVTTKITDLAIDWISQQSQPWFCWVAYTAPHTPFHLPPDSMHSQGALPVDQASIDANPFPYFLAMSESVDFELGRILKSMTSSELENTVVIFIGDNGSHPNVIQAPFSSTKAKGTLFQGGIHVPMIISGYGVNFQGERDSSLISTTDLFATICEIAGQDNGSYEDSQSFASVLTGRGQGPREFNYSEILADTQNKSGYTIRNDRYKLIVFDSGQRRFYDLLMDPYEETSLLNQTLNSEQQSALESLQFEAAVIRQ